MFARHLLRVDATARETLHRRYSRLLIDEFQDTDPIQIELATLIAASVGEVAPGTDWTDIAFDAERLFFVGDPKQSIYRFRRADIGLFLTARDTFGGTSARLSTNFRTVPPVLAWVNHVFDRLMDEEVPGRRPRYEALDGHRPDGPGDHRVRLLGSPHPKEEKLRAQELRELEAGAVADAVAGILAAPQSWPVERGGEWHPARPEDIAILVPTRTSLSVLMDALRARDVEFRSETGTLVYETQEIRDLLAILRTVAQPSDAVALVAALRSPILGCGDDDLVTYVRAGGRWDLGAPRPDLDAGHPVRRALAFLDALHAVRWWTAPSELLETVIRERRVMAIALASPRARDTWRRIRFLVDQARLYEASQSADLVGFVAWAELQRSEMARVHEPLLPESDDHAVRIMTIHGAKGLEFPITVVSGLTTRINARRGRFSVHWEGDAVELSARKDVATSGFDRLADIEDEMDEEEKLRLLYVVCTWARDHLLVAAHHVEGVKSFAQMVWTESEAAADSCRLVVRGGEAVPPRPGPTVTPPTVDAADHVARRDAWLAHRADVLRAGARRRTVSATALRQELASGPGSRGASSEVDDGLGRSDLGPAGADVVAPEWRRGRAATAFGRAVHAVLEHADLDDVASLGAARDRRGRGGGHGGACAGGRGGGRGRCGRRRRCVPPRGRLPPGAVRGGAGG